MRPYRAPMCSMVHTQRISGYFAESAVSGKVKRFSMSFNSCACPEISSLTAALCSAVAEFVCTTLEIWSIPCVTCSIETDWRSDAFAIFWNTSVIFCASSTTLSINFDVVSMLSVPFSTAAREAAINEVVELEASAVFPARLRTSSATTAKPFRPVQHGRPLQLHSGPVYWSEMRYPQWF